MTHLTTLHTLLDENRHLRAQRDELQRDCSRFEQEARDARAELRRMRGESVGYVVVPVISRRVTVAGAGSGVVANVVSFSDRSCVCTVDFGDAGMKAFAGKDVRFEPAQTDEHTPAAIPSQSKCEDKPAVVAKWRRCQTTSAWQLIKSDTSLVLATMLEDAGAEHPYRVTIGGAIICHYGKMSCADSAEYQARKAGFIPVGPIDRSALDEAESPAKDAPARPLTWRREGNRWLLEDEDGDRVGSALLYPGMRISAHAGIRLVADLIGGYYEKDVLECIDIVEAALVAEKQAEPDWFDRSALE